MKDTVRKMKSLKYTEYSALIVELQLFEVKIFEFRIRGYSLPARDWLETQR
jgi:hypothetical protein